jgi:hypothetical protein
MRKKLFGMAAPLAASFLVACGGGGGDDGGNSGDEINAPSDAQPPSLTLTKEVINDNGGTAVAGDWTLTAGGYDAATPAPGTYALSEDGGPSGYTQASLTCSNSGNSQVTSVTLIAGENVTCTFLNNDTAPTLTITNEVINDNGGTAEAADWTLTAAGYDPASPEIGTYELTATGPAGYTQTSLTCSNTGDQQVSSVTLGLGEDVICTFVHDDNGTEVLTITASTAVDPWTDKYNVYTYLKSPTGQCLYQGLSCSSLQDWSITQFKKVNGFNGISFGTGQTIWVDIDSDGLSDSIVKYSGNLSTYTAKHSPSAVRKGLFTYFTFSGEVPYDEFEAGNSKIGTTLVSGCDNEGSILFFNRYGTSPALGFYVSRYNHITGRVAKPVLVHMKCTNDPHDNAVINVDASGYVNVLVSGRGTIRGNFIFRSAKVDSIDGFIDVTPAMDNYLDYFNDIAGAAGIGRPFVGDAYRGINYPKMFWVDEPNGQSLGYFRLIYTIYCGARRSPITCAGTRQLYTARMHVEDNSASIQDIKPLAAYKGHYAVAHGRGQDIVVAFNLHLDDNIDNRSNLYYMHSVDGGETWLNSRNEVLTLPLVSPTDLDRVAVREYYEPDYEGSVNQRIYVKDVNFVGDGLNKMPTILYVGSLSADHFPSKNADHFLAKERWTGNSWIQTRLTDAVDHNYSSGMLFRADDHYRIFYPHTDEPKNNALAGGAVAYLDTGTGDDATGNPVLITEDVADPRIGDSAYLTDLCEFNYIKPVLNGSDDFVGILSGGNPYRNREYAPLFIVDLNGSVRRLPTSFSDDEVIDGEVSPKTVVSCLDREP